MAEDTKIPHEPAGAPAKVEPHVIPPEAIINSGLGAREAELIKEPSRLKRAFKILGPGLITGASDDDPAGVGTYASAGAALGFATLWTALVTFPLMAAVQYTCSKIGMIGGMGLAGIVRKHYPRKLLYPVILSLFVANTINIGADIGAIAAGINLLVPVPILVLIVPVSLAILVLLFLGSYRLITSIFKWLSLALFAYIAAAILSKPDPAEVIRGTFVPTIRFDAAFLMMLVAILGTTISPYLFFWQTSQEVEEEVSMGRKRLWQRRGTSDTELKYAFWDVNVGMLFSNVVMYFIVLATASTLHANGQTSIGSAAEAAQALRPVAGEAATVLFAIGIIGVGFLAVPVLAGSSAYAVSEAFGWKWGLDEKPERAKQFYGVIAISTLVGMLINYLGLDTIEALVWSSVINGLLAPPLLVLIMIIANNRSIMGYRVNGRVANTLGWLTAAALFAAAIALILTWV